MPATDSAATPTTDRWYSYAVVRIVPQVDRGEFINAGVVLFARTRRFLEARIELDTERLSLLAPDLNLEEIRRHLDVFQRIAAGDPEAGPVAKLSQSERFHWLTSPRSTVIQTSEVHIGQCDDPAVALNDLLARLVRRPSS